MAGTGPVQIGPKLCRCRTGLGYRSVNLPFRPDAELPAPRYGGLHDVLRDACPDAWGQALLRREHNLPAGTPLFRYLVLASNADPWGALAVGTERKPSVAMLASPKLP